MATVRITYTKSAIGYRQDQKDTIRALGFRRLNQTVEHEDSPARRGRIYAVTHLVTGQEDPACASAPMSSAQWQVRRTRRSAWVAAMAPDMAPTRAVA
ncbi:MAG: 50S ribosomal protein L30 [Thermoflexaceae bacterium]|nr:50S ribosomal protein L30 [Thermoflexaceae bacterium]